jgi:putative redox protein
LIVKATAQWQGRLSFTGTADSVFELPMGSDIDVGGDDDGFRPLELVAIGLAGCTGMDVISILKKKRQEITGFEVRVQAEQAEQHPMVFTRAVIEYEVTGRAVDEAAVVRSIELSALRYCPVQGMLKTVVPMELRYSIYEGDGQGERTLVASGVYQPVKDTV